MNLRLTLPSPKERVLRGGARKVLSFGEDEWGLRRLGEAHECLLKLIYDDNLYCH